MNETSDESRGTAANGSDRNGRAPEGQRERQRAGQREREPEPERERERKTDSGLLGSLLGALGGGDGGGGGGDAGGRTVQADGGTSVSDGGASGRVPSPSAGAGAAAFGRAYDDRLGPDAGPHLGLPSTLDEAALRRSVEERAVAGATQEAFVESYETCVDGLVDATFDGLEASVGDEGVRREVAAARDRLRTELHAMLGGVRTGVDVFADVAETDGLLSGLGVPVFALNTDREIMAWNDSMARMTDVPASRALGRVEIEELMYGDGGKTLAQKVLEAPETADSVFGVERADTDHTAYVDEGELTTEGGERLTIRFVAAPVYEDGDLVRVVERIDNRTVEVRKQERVEALVTELRETMGELQDGNLDARASFDGDGGSVDDSLLAAVDDLNEMAATLEGLVGDIDAQTGELGAAIDQSRQAVVEIDDRTTEQATSIAEVSNEMQAFGANMQEVAATADQITMAAKQAQSAAEEGVEAGKGARDATDSVVAVSEDLIDNVTGLRERMGEIEEIIDVIAEVADQTNLLALNANIEAARAGESGDGFGVVADEIKRLATETAEQTDEIARNIEQFKMEADTSADVAEESHEELGAASEQILAALDAFDEIAEAVEETATGIEDLAEANDEQAVTVEEVTATMTDIEQQAAEADDATAEIVAATEQQETVVSELERRVNRLTDGERLPGADTGSSD